jgi:hypothetical protein
MKQTAVEWFQDQIIKIVNGTCELSEIQIFEQAKEMEKQQIIDAFGVGCQVESTRLIGYQGMSEQYYKETFKQD